MGLAQQQPPIQYKNVKYSKVYTFMSYRGVYLNALNINSGGG